MNIIYLECKLLDITKHKFDFIGISVFSRFLIDNIWFVTFVSQIEGCGGLICHRGGLGRHHGCQTAAVASGGALCFLLCSIGEWRTFYVSRVADGISLFSPQSNFCNMYFSVVNSPNLIIFLQFSKITVSSLFSSFSVYLVSWTMFICLILFYVSTLYK
jgi:hypothetical protein